MKRLAFGAIVVCGLLFAWSVWYDRSLRRGDPTGHRNARACFDVAPGAREADLVAALGPPERTAAVPGGRRLFFHTLAAAAASITADVDGRTGKVLTLRCRDAEEPTWTSRP